MARETVPPDIAAAITAYGPLNRSMIEAEMKDAPEIEIEKVQAAVLFARASLEDAIRRHRRSVPRRGGRFA